jgi:hypothetical protein
MWVAMRSRNQRLWLITITAAHGGRGGAQASMASPFTASTDLAGARLGEQDV